MKQCTKCLRHLPIDRFATKCWTNSDGSVTKSKRSHCRDCVNSDNLNRYHTSDKTREAHRQASYRYSVKTYGIDMEQYQKMLKEQNNCCAICKKPSKKRLCVDHNHTTGKIRALLCNPCNTAIGHSKEDIEILKEMIKYLETHNGSMGL